MDLSRAIALSIFSSYFLLILTFFAIIVRSIRRSNASKSRDSESSAYIFGILAAISFGHTWLYMFRYLTWSFQNYEKNVFLIGDNVLDRITSWLLNTELFEQAWAAVSFEPVNWWWSQQLCLFTAGAWTIFLATEGQRNRIPHLWAYMLLGQLVAISVASNLFYLALTLSPPQEKPSRHFGASKTLCLCVLASLITIGISPYTTEQTFLPNLLAMHALLILPLLPYGKSSNDRSGSVPLGLLYSAVAFICLGLRMHTIWTTIWSLPVVDRSFFGFLGSVWQVLYSHPAQSSIGWDVIWTTISFITWAMLTQTYTSQVSIVALIEATLFGSIGLAAPYYLAPDLGEEGEDKVKGE